MSSESSSIERFDAERQIQHHLDLLPDELRAKWQERYDAVSDEDLPSLEKELRSLVRRREAALHQTGETMGEFRHTEQKQEEIYATLAKIGEAAERADLHVGEGKTAEVFRDAYEPDVCYKSVKDFVEYGAWNSIGKEAQFLEELESFEVQGVRTPRLKSVIDLPTVKALSMEYLDAKNVKVLVEKELPLPENFDVDIFFKRVYAYVEAMHARGIYHRDLHAGNILIGRDGTPYIVDFGRSVKSITEEDAYAQYDRAGLNKIVLVKDENYVAATEALLRSYIIKQRLKARAIAQSE